MVLINLLWNLLYLTIMVVHNGLNKPAVKPIVFDQSLYKTLYFDNLKENKAPV